MVRTPHFMTCCLVLVGCTYTAPIQTDEEGEPITISFVEPMTNADERSNVLPIELILSAPPEVDPISVRCSVAGGSAMVGADFTLDSQSVTFEVGETRKVVMLTILEDGDEQESIETIDLVLSEPVGALLDLSTHVVSISNLILPRLTFVQTSTTTTEGVQSSLSLMLDGPATNDATFALAITQSTATPVDDFAVVDGTVVTIPAGMTTATIPIGEVPDDLDEDDEDVVFGLKDLSLNILTGANNATTHLITDDDAEPGIGFAEAGRTVDEPGGTFQLEVLLTAPSGRTVTVSFARDAADSAADNDATVTGSPGTLTFAAGEVSKTIDIKIEDDALDEDTEEVIVRLSGETNAILGQADHTTTIGDNDAEPTVAFTSASSDDREDDTLSFETVTMTLSAASGRSVTVPFTASGTLTFPNEYSLTASPIVFAPGQTIQFVTIDWNRDGVREPDETVILTLSTPTNATPGTTTVHTFTLRDDD